MVNSSGTSHWYIATNVARSVQRDYQAGKYFSAAFKGLCAVVTSPLWGVVGGAIEGGARLCNALSNRRVHPAPTEFAMNLQHVIENPALNAQFSSFLQSEHSPENLEFLMAASTLERESSAEDALPQLLALRSKYIESDLVNVSGNAKQALDSAIARAQDGKASTDVGEVRAALATVVHEVRELVSSDTLVRFAASQRDSK